MVCWTEEGRRWRERERGEEGRRWREGERGGEGEQLEREGEGQRGRGRRKRREVWERGLVGKEEEVAVAVAAVETHS